MSESNCLINRSNVGSFKFIKYPGQKFIKRIGNFQNINYNGLTYILDQNGIFVNVLNSQGVLIYRIRLIYMASSINIIDDLLYYVLNGRELYAVIDLTPEVVPMQQKSVGILEYFFTCCSKR